MSEQDKPVACGDDSRILHEIEDNLPARLRRLYVDTGANYVQEAADTIEALQAALGNSGNRHIYTAPPGMVFVAQGAIERLTAERDALRADAERYRYLRNRAPENVLNVTGRLAGCWIDCDSDLGDRLILLTGDDADAAIDAARTGSKT